MKPPFVYDTDDDLSRLQVLMDIPDNTPIHLTTAINPLPEELGELQNITYLHAKRGNNVFDDDDRLIDIICNLKSLETLIIERPIPYRRPPDNFYKLSNLKHIAVYDNDGFSRKALTEDFGNFSKLESLEIRGYYRGKLPEAIGQLKGLKRLIVRDTNSYMEGGSDIGVPDTIWNLTNLREIRIGPGYSDEVMDADRVVDLTALEVFEFLIPVKVIPDAFWQLPNLCEVNVRAYEQSTMPSLAETQLTSLKFRMALPILPDLPKTLEKLDVSSHFIGELPSLKDTIISELSLHGTKIRTVPDLPETLETLNLSYLAIISLPDLPPLKHLMISSCYELAELPELPETLTSLQIGYCSKLFYLPEVPRLKHLWLVSCKSLSKLPARLVVDTLSIDYCSKLSELPDDLVVLSKIWLTGMEITKMPQFPSNVEVVIHDDY